LILAIDNIISPPAVIAIDTNIAAILPLRYATDYFAIAAASFLSLRC